MQKSDRLRAQADRAYDAAANGNAEAEITGLLAKGEELEAEAERASAAYEAEQGWAEGIRAGLSALLAFFDSEPELARLCVLHATPASPAI